MKKFLFLFSFMTLSTGCALFPVVKSLGALTMLPFAAQSMEMIEMRLPAVASIVSTHRNPDADRAALRQDTPLDLLKEEIGRRFFSDKAFGSDELSIRQPPVAQPDKLYQGHAGFFINPRGAVLTWGLKLVEAEKIEIFMDGSLSISGGIPMHVAFADLHSQLVILEPDEPFAPPLFLSLEPHFDIRMGHLVAAMGTSNGLAENLFIGLVSGLNRHSYRLPQGVEFLQLNLPVDWGGGAGGPLFNIHGELIGLLTNYSALFPRPIFGIHFAITIPWIQELACREPKLAQLFSSSPL